MRSSSVAAGLLTDRSGGAGSSVISGILSIISTGVEALGEFVELGRQNLAR
jgi:hypothetical protein